jgi:MscS family membrane protein
MDVQSFEDFTNLIKEIWTQGVYGVNVSAIIMALGIILFALIVRRLFSKFIIARLKHFTDKTENDFDDQILKALEKPLRFVPIVAGVFFATEVVGLSNDTGEFAYSINKTLITFNIFWVVFNVISPLIHSLRIFRNIFTQSMMTWFVKVIDGLICFIGAAAILEIWGIEIGPLIAGLGLFGVAVALGAQNVFKNLIAGLFILGEKRFFPGDWIKVDGVVEGTVKEIGFRTTTVVRFDKSPVYVPNSKLSDNAVTNFSRMTHRRIYWKIGLTYDTSVAQLRAVRGEIEKYISKNDDFAKAPEVTSFVRIDSFNDSSVDLMLYCFTKTTNWMEWLEIKEDFACRIKEIVAEQGSDFAFPSQTIYLDQTAEKAEDFPFGEKQEI